MLCMTREHAEEIKAVAVRKFTHTSATSIILVGCVSPCPNNRQTDAPTTVLNNNIIDAGVRATSPSLYSCNSPQVILLVALL